MKRKTLFLWFPILLLLLLSSCSTQRSAHSAAEELYLSSKVSLTVPYQGSLQTLRGTLRLVSDERAQLSLLMPILRTELVRLELTPDTVLLVDRMGHRYVQATRQELRPMLPRRATFANLERLLRRASRSDKPFTLSANQLGLPHLEGAKLVLSDFSSNPFTLTPTRLSSRYREVPLEDLLKLLTPTNAD